MLVLEAELHDTLYGTEMTQGFQVHIHDQKETAKLLSDTGFSVATGAQTSFILSRKKVTYDKSNRLIALKKVKQNTLTLKRNAYKLFSIS